MNYDLCKNCGPMGLMCASCIEQMNKIEERNKCPALIKHLKEGEKIIKDLQENQEPLPMGRYGG